MNIKVISLILLFICGLVYRDSTVAILFSLGFGTLLAMILGFFFQPLSMLGRFFIPYGLVTIIVGFVLTAIPPIPGLGSSGFGVFPTAPAVPLSPLAQIMQLPAMRVVLLGCGIGASLFLIGSIVVTSRTKLLIKTRTHPLIANALKAQGKFDGYVTVDGSVSADGRMVLETPKQRTILADHVEPEVDPLVSIPVRPAHLLDTVVAELCRQGVSVQYGELTPQSATIKVPKVSESTVKLVLERLAGTQAMT